MINKEVILVSGYSRGGSNLLWNLLQSHPEVCAPRYEMGTIFRNHQRLKFAKFIQIARKLGIINTSLLHRMIDLELYRHKMQTLSRDDNRYKYEDEPYAREEVKNSVLCLKSVDDDIDETDLLLEVYPGLAAVFLVRNGYAVAESHLRRGRPVAETAELYKRVGKKMSQYAKRTKKSMFVTFEEILSDPFSLSEKLYQFADLKPETLNKLRLKSKKVVNKEGRSEPAFGEADRKYWFDRNSIQEIIVPDINQKQVSTLSPEQIRTFNEIAADTLIDFSYSVIEP